MLIGYPFTDVDNLRIEFVALCKIPHAKINCSDGSVGNTKSDPAPLTRAGGDPALAIPQIRRLIS